MRVHIAAAVLCLGLVAACGGGRKPVAEPPLSPEAAQGKQLASAKNCLTCHTLDGRPGPGPTWNGAFGSTVTLVDGTKVKVDEAYLFRAIKDPFAERVRGYVTVMPRNNLTDAEAQAIVAYIKALGRTG